MDGDQAGAVRLATLRSMLLHRRQHRRSAWLALLLFAMATLTPAVSRAMAHVQGQIAPWATLCVAVEGTGLDGQADALQHLTTHCLACHLQADQLAPPPPSCASLAPRPDAGLLPVAAASTPAAVLAWTRAQPRAPPSAH
jgi:Protein of unknown function (DUF2946)